ncbi:thiamine-phosphate kinase [Nostoc sp. 'Lobaria pulmonaria (5183) cyanobiont']|uniref:thiamine-phosphate kinase n=1 Tax=Nostoc sp. 'Lobaria pulmonaria (5183) cyanobiont' TaxID=1618022 RepID=UPI000CF30172|nr:thiamine-phosphate kinase [Nostoc sp. 'Lobaria pulmonaria (5183) cyanobiont']AVH73548.1 thiamine monophosphate kinase [Nostoc sp. 'Lobaria pulmonaria (5183) cyanobiont']
MNSELSSQQVKDIGEQGLLERLQRFCPPEIIGDDAAVLETAPGQFLVVTTDVLVDGIHFSNLTTSPEDAGWRAVTANLSDLAAMGASPLGITVGLGLPGELRVSWVERLYQGMTECLQKYNTPIVGGDVVRSPVTTLAITAFGQVNPSQIIRRSAAAIGDAIVVTGVHGASHAGLELLLHPELGENLNNEEKTALIRAHQRPQPRLDVLAILWKILTPNFQLSIAGMDSSDGLADAIIQICRTSGVGAVLERRQIPLPKTFNHWLTPDQALAYALYGGEDFELVLCLPQELASTLVQHLGEGAAIAGRITAGSTVILHDEQKKFPDQVLSLDQGFQHFGQ